MKNNRLRRASIAMGLVGFFSVAIITAQGECAALLTRAVAALEDNCAALSRNTACYGYNLVEAGFTQAQPDDFFTLPADRASLADLSVIRTSSLDLTNDQWGVALLSVQANIPNSLPGQSVTFILLGDTELENAVTPEETFTAADPITVKITQNARVRSGPGANFNIIGIAEADTQLDADALSSDAEWLRVAFKNRPMWISRMLVQPDEALSALPQVDGTQRSTMQAFYLRNGIGASDCVEAENSLIVQGPKNITIDLTVNGANLTIGSTVVLNAVDDELVVTVIDGTVTIDEDQDGVVEQTVRTGQQSRVCLGSPQNLGIDGESNDREVSCAFSAPIDIPFEELGAQYCNLEGVPADVLAYPIDLLCAGESRETYLAEVLPPTPVAAPVQPIQPDSTTTGGTGDCSGLALIAPLGAVPLGQTTFSWSPAASVEQYFVNFYGVDGANTYGAQVDSTVTSISVDTTTVPQGDRLQWEVLGVTGGQVVCNTGRTAILQRDEPVVVVPPPANNEEGAAPVFTGSWSCSNTNVVVPWSWMNAPAGSTIHLHWTLNGITQIAIRTGASGSANAVHTGNSSTISGYLEVNPGGLIYSLPTLTNCGNA